MGLSRNELTMAIVLLAGTLLAVLNQTFLSPALPVIMQDMQVSATTVQWLTSAYAMVEAVVIPLNAYLLGRFSTRKLYIGAMGIFAAGSVACAAAPFFGLLLVGRMMQAMATGIAMPMVFTLILLMIPRERRGSAMGVIGLVISFAPAIGPAVSGALVDAVGWHALFVIVSLLALVVVALAALKLENRSGFERTAFDAPSMVMSSLGMVALLYGLSSLTSSPAPWASALLIVAGIGLLGLFARRQLHLDAPMLRVDVLATQRFRRMIVAIALMNAGLIATDVLMPLFLQDILGATPTVTGLAMLPAAVAGAVTGLFSGRIFDRRGVRGVAAAGAAVLFASCLAMAFWAPETTVLEIGAVYLVQLVGWQLVSTPLTTWGVNSLDNAVIQHGNALTSTFQQVGGSFGTAAIVSLTALGPLFATAGQSTAFAGYHVAFIGLAALMAVVSVLIVVFTRAKDAAASAAAAETDVFAQAVPKTQPAWTVADVMDRSLAHIDEGATVGEVMEVLVAAGTNGLPILDAHGHVCAFISDGDIMRYLGESSQTVTGRAGAVVLEDAGTFEEHLAALKALDATRIATRRVVAVEPQMTVEAACHILADRRIKKVPVVQDGRLMGTISRRNIMRALSRYDAEVLPAVSA